MSIAEQLEALLDADRVATILRTDRKGVSQLVYRGRLKSAGRGAGRVLLFSPSEVQRFIEKGMQVCAGPFRHLGRHLGGESAGLEAAVEGRRIVIPAQSGGVPSASPIVGMGGDLSSERRDGTAQPIAALYVQTGGGYFGIEGVDPWDEKRDARLYPGPHPVVAHPPCERWGRYWHGGPSAKVRRVKGDDGGCFVSALWAVRKFGGVLEHPEASAAWAWFGLHKPPRGGGWVVADMFDGWTCCVEQAHYGHRARKATWLYARGVALPSLRWGRAEGVARLDDGCHSSEERAQRKAAGTLRVGARRMTGAENAATPEAFRDVLIEMARSVGR